MLLFPPDWCTSRLCFESVAVFADMCFSAAYVVCNYLKLGFMYMHVCVGDVRERDGLLAELV